jgi:hypothetical protein
MILLSILMPTVVGREIQITELLQSFSLQTMLLGSNRKIDWETTDLNVWRFELNGIEVIVYQDNKEISIGEKRNRLYKMASGTYSVMWDDDDGCADSSLRLITKALKSEPDCVGYKEMCNIDGVQKTSNFSLRYTDWHDNPGDGFDYARTPFFKTPILTSLCQQVGVTDMRFGEDHDFARRIKPLLHKEEYIDEFIYHYNHVSTDHNERYGITS